MSCCCTCGWSKWYDPDAKRKQGTTLIQLEIGHLRDAHDVIGEIIDMGDGYKSYTPLILVPRNAAGTCCCFQCCWMSIPEGFTAIVSKWGKVIPGDTEIEDVPVEDENPDGETRDRIKGWAPGWHCFYPCCQKVDRLVTKQLVIFDTPVKDCKTKDDITVNIDVIIVFHVFDAWLFVETLGPEKLDDLLRASQEEVLKTWVYQTEIQSVYDLHGSNTDDFVADMNKSVQKYGIKVHHFTVKDVAIPKNLADDFEGKTLYESKTAESQMVLEMDRLKLNNSEEQLKLHEELANHKFAAEEKNLTQKAQITKEVRETIANTDKAMKVIAAKRDEAVQDVTVSADFNIAELHAEILKLKNHHGAVMQRDVGRLEAESKSYEEKKIAQAKMEGSLKINEGKKGLAEAEGLAAEAFAARRAQQQALLKLDVLEKITENKKVRIVTSQENDTGLAHGNSLVSQSVQQGLEAFRMKLAETTAKAASNLKMDARNQGGVVRPLPSSPPQQRM